MFEADVNFGGVLLGALTFFIFGLIWYAPMSFGKTWGKITDAKPKKDMGSAFLLGFISSIGVAYVLDAIMNKYHVNTIEESILMAFWIWLGFYATTALGRVIWEGKPWKLFFINAIYYLIALVLAAIVMSFWV